MSFMEADVPGADKRMRVAIVSSVLPRQCGIATFSDKLSNGLEHLLGRKAVSYIALCRNEAYKYPAKVNFRIEQEQLEDYWRAADHMNQSEVDVVSLQHEFGLFGGEDGQYIVDFLSRLNKPVVTTMHTVLEKPTPGQYKTLIEVAAFSKAIIVMNQTAIKILTEIYGLEASKIHLIPHGVPDGFYIAPEYYKNKLDLTNRFIILTFGLLGRNKGIETALRALRPAVRRYSDILYIVLGITHPVVKAHEGEAYREYLINLVEEYDLQNNVRFINEFVDDETLDAYLGAADLVICPYHSEAQITSGVLSLSMGKGKAIISTPYLHAKEVLSAGKGRLVHFKDSNKMGEIILDLIENPEERLAMGNRAWSASQDMGWDKVSCRYAEIFEKEVELCNASKRGAPFENYLPKVNMDYLKKLTDDVGMIQQTYYGIPDYTNDYSADDAARAMVAFSQYYNLFKDDSVLNLLDKYMAFIVYARREDGWFHNFMNYQKGFPPQEISQDTFGRCLWGLGAASNLVLERIPGILAQTMVEESLPMLGRLTYTRAQAYAVLGLAAYLTMNPEHDEVKNGIKHLCDALLVSYMQTADGIWNWFEDFLSYDNARLPQALLMASLYLRNPNYLKYGLASLDFLIKVQYHDGYFDMIGNKGWYFKGKERALYCQQPLDAGSLTETCLLAHYLTNDKTYLEMAHAAFQWYLGRNRQGKIMYDPKSGACVDGLSMNGPSRNKGAEATLSFVMALVCLYRWEFTGVPVE